MSRYLILVLLNLPLIIMGLLRATVAYKMGQISRQRLLGRCSVWIVILLGLIFAQPIYEFLFSKNLTQTEPLSLFDVIQTTGIITTFFIANLAYTRADNLERRLKDLHQAMSIKLAEKMDKSEPQ